ncbi:hypothetical protein RZS08_56560, partial [Arthrospira platensis SPKY1]|nr:hypothetical protein [Arthrospira platensis SPKY1]
VGLERLADHQGSEVRAADADIDDIGDHLAGMAAPRPAAHSLAEAAHLLEHGQDVRHDVVAVDHNGGTRAVAQSRVQDRPALGRVDLVASEHRVTAAFEVTCLCELDQERHGLGRHP